VDEEYGIVVAGGVDLYLDGLVVVESEDYTDGGDDAFKSFLTSFSSL
jgi:hypothetical protein